MIAILQMLTILASVVGVNRHSHICHQSGTVAVSIIPEEDSCSKYECCQDEPAPQAEVSCCGVVAPISCVADLTDSGLNSTKCCEDASDYFAMALSLNLQEKIKIIDISNLCTFGKDSFNSDITFLDVKPLQDDDIFIQRSCIASIIEFIHHSSFVASIA